MIFLYVVFMLLGLVLLMLAALRTVLYCTGATRLLDRDSAMRKRRVRSIHRQWLAAAASFGVVVWAAAQL